MELVAVKVPRLDGVPEHDLDSTTKRHRVRSLIEEILPKVDNYVWMHDSLCRSLDPANINKRIAEFSNDEDPRMQAAASVFLEGVVEARGKMLKVFQALDAVEDQADTRMLLLSCEFERLSQLPVPDRLREKISLLYNPLLQRKFGRVEAQAVFEICRSLDTTVVDYQKLHRLLWNGLCHGSQGPAGGTQSSEMQENMAVWDSNVQGVREKVFPILRGISPFVLDADEFKTMFLGWGYRDDLSGIPKCFSRVF
ncbi:hypothetical protein Q9189_006226 [Teloschistes chrysophthalmus]